MSATRTAFEDWRRDGRRVLRRLSRERASTLASVLVVGLAVAAVGSALAIAEAFLLRPLAGVREQEHMVNVHRRAVASGELERVTFEEYRGLAGAASLRGLTAYTDFGFVLDAAPAEPAEVTGMFVAANYFDVLGTSLSRGRGFVAADEVPGAAPVAVLSHGLWQRLGGGEIVGRQIRLDGVVVEVVGVAPAGFSGTFFAFPFDLWLPVGAAASVAPQLDAGAAAIFELTGRLAAGTEIQGASSELELRDAAQRGAASDGERRTIDVRSLSGIDDNLRSGVVGLISVLVAGALLLLVVAGLNVGGVALARGLGRARETAIETALGAGRIGLLRGQLAESLLVFAAGAAAGVWGAFGVTGWLRRFEPPFSVPLVFDVAPRPGVLAVAVLIALAAGLAVGLLPARQLWRQRAGAAAALGGGTRGTAAAGVSRSLRLVVALEVALALVLLVSAALFARSLGGARALDPGFAMDSRWAFRVAPVGAGLDAGRRSEWFEGLVERLAATPGIDAAAQTTRLPLGLGSTTTRAGLTIAGGVPVSLEVDVQAIDGGYLPALAIPLVAGRNLEARDGESGGRPVALVNETLARRLIGGSERPVVDALGRVVASDGVERVVVGVARDSKVRRVWEEPRPLLQVPAGPSVAGPRTLVVVSRLDRAAIADLVAREVRAFDPAVPRPVVLSLEERAAISLLPQRLAGAIAAALGAVCLAVAAAGLFGVVAFWVAARTQEIGIRRALGATDGALRRLVLRQCLHQLALGAGLGLPLAAGAGFLLRGLLVGIGPFDPLALAAAGLVLAVAALLAAWSPLRRALRVDPAGALRGEGALR